MKGGRIYQRLKDVVGQKPELHSLNGLRNAFLGDKAGPPAATIEEWCELAKERYKDDEGLVRVMLQAATLC